MVKNNPYIDKVSSHPKIIDDQEKIYYNKGKWSDFFWNDKWIRLEIWTGLWNFFSYETNRKKDKNFIWMEIKFKRCFKTAEKTLAKWISDFVILKDYGQNIDKIFEEEIEQTYVFFPDPWPKDRHAKHRLLQKEFLEKLHNITKTWWKLVYKTDHKKYFEDTLEIIEKEGIWEPKIISFDYENELLDVHEKKSLTEFEVIFRNKDVKICYAEFIKKES